MRRNSEPDGATYAGGGLLQDREHLLVAEPSGWRRRLIVGGHQPQLARAQPCGGLGLRAELLEERGRIGAIGDDDAAVAGSQAGAEERRHQPVTVEPAEVQPAHMVTRLQGDAVDAEAGAASHATPCSCARPVAADPTISAGVQNVER